MFYFYKIFTCQISKTGMERPIPVKAQPDQQGQLHGILFHPDFIHELVTVKPDLSGRLRSLKIKADGKLLDIVSVYAPTNPTERKRFHLNELKNHLA